jgi:hypothetical protein
LKSLWLKSLWLKSATVAPSLQPVPEATTPIEVELNNGIVIKGTILTTTAFSWVPGQPLSFTTENGHQSILAAEQIKKIRNPTASSSTEAAIEQMAQVFVPEVFNYESPGGFNYDNVGKSRHLYAPSAIGLKQGEGYFSQKLVFSAVAVGATDNLTLLAGTFTFFPPLLTIVGGKVSGEVAPNVHLAAGAEVFMTGMGGFETLAKVGFGGITFGHDDSQITFSSGYMALGAEGYGSSAIPLIVAGQWRVSDRGVLVTENWFVIPTEVDKKPLVLSVAYRLLGGRADTRMSGSNKWSSTGAPKYTWDFGMIGFSPGVGDTSYGPFPWIDFAWHFGSPGR